jgi:hypothetical protein
MVRQPLAALVDGIALAVAATATACDKDGETAPPLPPAEAYDRPSDFSGDWIGEVETTEGTLTITPLGAARYRGVYEVDGAPIRYVLALEQTMLDVSGAPVPSNRVVFTWQDGRGGRGEGWLLINRENTALTGEFGEGAGHTGGAWTFIRLE